MQVSNHQFTDMGIDPMLGAEIFTSLGVDQLTLDNPVSFQKLQDIIKFFNGKQDAPYIIRRALGTKKNAHGTAVDHIWEMSQLLGQRMKMKDELKKVEDDLTLFGF